MCHSHGGTAGMLQEPIPILNGHQGNALPVQQFRPLIIMIAIAYVIAFVIRLAAAFTESLQDV